MNRAILGIAAGAILAVLFGVGVGVVWIQSSKEPKPEHGSSDSGLYCTEHGVPEKFCTICHAELTKTLLLCPEHGNIPEDICTKCHPEVEKQHKIKMCPKGHGLPEHFCVDCGKVVSSASEPPDDGWCATHDKPESLCEVCLKNPEAHERDATAATCRRPLPLVRLASSTLGRRIGLETAPAVMETHAHTLEANAETAFNANRYADVSPRVAGFLREVKVDLGQRVKAGDVLAYVDSPEVSTSKSRHISAKAALNLAKVAYERTKTLAKESTIPAKQELEALTTLNQAESTALDAAQSLRNLGLLDSELERIVTAKETSSLLPIVSPMDGVVVQRHAVRGEAVQPATLLFAVADISTMWLWIDVYEAERELVAENQSVSFSISGINGPDFQGKITWIGAQVDPTTRTTRVRAELANPDGRLRANQFGQALISVEKPHEVLVVPKSAVQTNERTDVVFIPQGERVYRPQRILGKPSNRGDVVEVEWGLKPGDLVVTKGSFWLKTEIMKGAIGAGCCE